MFSFSAKVMLVFGGLADVLFFIFWGGDLPDFSVIWWWASQYALFGFWNSLLQLLLLSAVILIVVLMWIQRKSFGALLVCVKAKRKDSMRTNKYIFELADTLDI